MKLFHTHSIKKICLTIVFSLLIISCTTSTSESVDSSNNDSSAKTQKLEQSYSETAAKTSDPTQQSKASDPTSQSKASDPTPQPKEPDTTPQPKASDTTPQPTATPEVQTIGSFSLKRINWFMNKLLIFKLESLPIHSYTLNIPLLQEVEQKWWSLFF